MSMTMTYNQPPEGVAQVNAYHPAAAAVPHSISPQELVALQQKQLRENQDNLNKGAGDAAAGLIEMGASEFAKHGAKLTGFAGAAGAAGYGGTLLAAAYGGNHEKNKELEKLTELYRKEISVELGIPEGEVTSDHTRWFAEYPDRHQLREAVNEIDQKIVRRVTSSGAGLAGSVGAMTVAAPLLAGTAFATGGLGLLATIPISMVGGAIASTVADKAVTSISGQDVHDSAYKELNQMQEKLIARQPVDTIDVFKVLLAGDTELQAAIKQEANEGFGKDFDKLEPEEQAHLLSEKYPGLLDASRQLAYEINVGAVLPTRLLTLNTLALVQGGAPAAYAMTRDDIMQGMGVNVTDTANNISSFSRETPSTSVSTAGAVSTTMRPRAPGIGPQQAALMDERADITRERAQMDGAGRG